MVKYCKFQWCYSDVENLNIIPGRALISHLPKFPTSSAKFRAQLHNMQMKIFTGEDFIITNKEEKNVLCESNIQFLSEVTNL